MTPQNTANGSTVQSHNRKRSQAAPSRVAIPLPLSKPRAPKPQPQPARDPATEAPAKKELAEQFAKRDDAVAGDARDEAQKAMPSTNGATNAAMTNADQETPRMPTAEVPTNVATSFSNGTTPEQSQDGQVRSSSSTGTITSAPTSLADATPLRKPSNIRTELPPAFIPSTGQRTPVSSSSSRPMNRNSQPFQPQAQYSRPSTGNIIFGDADSSESSPAPPHSAGSAFVPPPHQQMQRPFQPPAFPPGHAHHFSESQSYPMHPAGYTPQQPWTPQRAFFPSHQQPPLPPHVQHQYRYPAQEPFDATQTNLPSSLSRPTSPGFAHAEALRSGQDLRSSVGPAGAQQFPEPRPMPNQLPFRQPPFARQMPPQQQQIPPPDFRLDMENAQMLRDHVRSQFSKPAFADCLMQISHDLDASTQRIDAHRILLARSPTLLRLMQGATASSSVGTQLNIHLPGKYMSLHAFNECLKYIYGGQLPPLEPPHRQSISFVEPISAQIERMENALQRLATGAWLDMPAIAWRGMNVATNSMTWHTLATALEFGLEGGISPMWTLDDGSEDRGSTTSSDDSHVPMSSSPTHDPFSTQILQSIFQFVSNNFPLDFYPDTAAPQLGVCPRLPPLPPKKPQQQHEKKVSRSNDPRLSQIRFGELPSEQADSPRPSPVTTIISSLLFSLPFQLLKFLLEHPVLAERLGPETVGSIIRQTVLERESRRKRCLQVRSAPQENGDETVANLHWEETVEDTGLGRLGLRLCRRRKGVDTPPSSTEGASNHDA